MPDAQEYLFHSSAVNGRFRTHDGFDRCGTRLADEVRELLARHPSLSKLSVIGHSMGGMIARFALGLLFRPEDGSIAGLAPRHFVTLATPHLGLTVDEGPAQVPFVDWSGRMPLLGPGLKWALQAAAHAVASHVFRGTGRHFLALDGGPGEAPLLMRLTMDEPDRGRYFFSALRAFASRAAYGNVARDHWVRWENATVRGTADLPHIAPDSVRRGRGVVREDPLEAGFDPGLQRPHPPPPGGQGQPGTAAGGAERGNAPPPADVTASAGAREAVAATTQQVAGGEEGASASQPTAEARGDSPAAAQRARQQAVPAGMGSGSGTGPGLGPEQGVWSAEALLEAAHHPPRLPPLHAAGTGAGPWCTGDAGAAAAGAGAGAPCGSAGAPPAVAAAPVDDLVLECAVERCAESPQQVVAFALARLRLLPWRRVDVSFAGARLGTAHNNIQATRWTNLEGRGVLAHLRQHLQAAEELAESRM